MAPYRTLVSVTFQRHVGFYLASRACLHVEQLTSSEILFKIPDPTGTCGQTGPITFDLPESDLPTDRDMYNAICLKHRHEE